MRKLLLVVAVLLSVAGCASPTMIGSTDTGNVKTYDPGYLPGGD